MKSSVGLFYQIKVTDKNGKIVRKTRLRRSKSFCLAFLQAVEVQFSNATVLIKDTLAANISTIPAVVTLSTLGPEANDSQSLLLGTGTTTPTNIDYVMETKIAHGSGAGELNHAATSFITSQVVGPNVDFQVLRSFQNLSGSPINVTEAGIYSTLTSGKFGLTVHDVFTAVPVADGETITVTYTFRTTV